MPSWNPHDEKAVRRDQKILPRTRQERATRPKRSPAARSTRQRREHGETPSDKTQGTGNPNTSLDDRTADELRNRAAELNDQGVAVR